LAAGRDAIVVQIRVGEPKLIFAGAFDIEKPDRQPVTRRSLGNAAGSIFPSLNWMSSTLRM
jgi:hypothetical protein